MRRFGKAGVAHLKRELRQDDSAERSRAAKVACFSVKLCGPLFLCGENIGESIYHRDHTEKNFDEIDALLISPLRFSFLDERVHAFTRVFSLHQFVQIKILDFPEG